MLSFPTLVPDVRNRVSNREPRIFVFGLRSRRILCGQFPSFTCPDRSEGSRGTRGGREPFYPHRPPAVILSNALVLSLAEKRICVSGSSVVEREIVPSLCSGQALRLKRTGSFSQHSFRMNVLFCALDNIAKFS